ncbi:MAG: type II CRISPR-associated endonuclease Cas1 [Planctomycetia bacterium]|nr:MAG: type II CRISPR-associated endonuclease Cas1 [Planctomycetia bacterium]
MTERILDLSTEPALLRTENEQLCIGRGRDEIVRTPLAELAAVLLTHPQVTCTQPALAGILRHGGAVIVCGADSLPVGMMLPLVGHSTHTERVLAQAACSRPRAKRLWQQVVRAKIRAQAALLRDLRGDDAVLSEMIRLVRSGDSTFVESRAAQRYWPLLFGDPAFVRRREAHDQNRYLNYGYAVLRAIVGRAIVATGLHPALGLHHHNRYDPFALAADLMEPLRPCVDRVVCEVVGCFGRDSPLQRGVKAALLEPLLGRWNDGAEARTLFDWSARLAQSLAAALAGGNDRLLLPDELLPAGASDAQG